MKELDSKIVSQRMVYARKKKNLTLEEVGQALNVHKSAVLRWENGQTRKIKLPIIESLARLYNVNSVWLMGYDVPENSSIYGESEAYTIPILGTVKAGYDSLVEENILGRIAIDKLCYKNSGEYFALKIKGDSMKPELCQDDIVVVHKQSDFENNELCIVLINGDEATVKRVKRINNGIILQPANPDYETLIFTDKEVLSKPVQIIGVVKELKRSY